MNSNLLRHLEMEVGKEIKKLGKRLPFYIIKNRVLDSHAKEIGDERSIYSNVISSDFGRKGGKAAAEKRLINQFLRSVQIEQSADQELAELIHCGYVMRTDDDDLITLEL